MWILLWMNCVVLLAFFWVNSLLDKKQYTIDYIGYDSVYLNTVIGELYVIFFYLVVKLITGHLRLINTKHVFVMVYERIIFPIMAICIPLLFDRYSIQNVTENNFYFYLNLIVLFVFLLDPLNIVHKYYMKVGFYKRDNELYLYLSFPPKKLIDVLPFFIFINCLYVFLGLI